MTTELYLNGYRIDIENDIQFPITFSLSDIENPMERQSTYSKTIEIVSTTNNDFVFGNIYMFDQYVIDFNPTIKAHANVIQNGIEIFTGVGQLLKIKQTDNVRVYEIGLFGETANLMRSISTKYLTDIDFSDLNHTWNSMNVSDTWNGILGSGYVYPIIDYGQIPSGDRQNTPPASSLYTTEQFFPAIYVKEYFDRIISDAGFTYQSNFVDSELFKRLIVPYGISGRPLLPNEILFQSLFRIGLTGGVQDIADGTIQQINFGTDTPSPLFNGGSYSVGTYEWNPPFDAPFNFELHLNCQPNLSIIAYDQTITAKLRINGSPVATFFSYTWGPNDGHVQQLSGVVENISVTNTDSIDVSVEFSVASPSPISPSPYVRIFTDESFWLNQCGDVLMQDGFEWVMNQTIVPKIKQNDFMSWIFRMFNMYVMPDKYNSKHLYIEPFDDFYNPNDINDWTNKWDVKKEMNIEPVAMSNIKTFLFTHNDGGGWIEKNYKTTFGESYGSRKYEISNEFATDEQSEQNIFAISPLSGYTSSSRLYSRIWDLDRSGNVTPIVPGLRIMFFNYLDYPYQNGIFVFNGTPFYKYPYAGHLDDIYNPQNDLCFGIPRELYYSTNTETNQFWKYTNGNLFNKYWLNYVNQMTDKDSKMVSMFINLTPSDILNLDFRKYVFIGNTLFRLISVNNYDSNSHESTECQFVKILDLAKFNATQFDLTSGAGAEIDDETKPQTIVE